MGNLWEMMINQGMESPHVQTHPCTKLLRVLVPREERTNCTVGTDEGWPRKSQYAQFEPLDRPVIKHDNGKSSVFPDI